MSAPFTPSMPAGSHEMRDYYSNQDPPRFTPHTAPSITPYLGLRARLSQVPINRWTILLLLVLARTLISISSINQDLASARREALSACSDVEAMGSTLASMPHYMSQGLNEMTAKGIEKSVNGLMTMTTMSVTATEEIAVFVWNMLTSTYTCLITLAVHGAVGGVADVLKGAQADIDTLTKSVTGEIADSMGKFGDAYKTLETAIEGVSFLGKSITIPNLPDLTKQNAALTSFKLPDLTAPFRKLNSTIPDFAEVKNLTDSLIRTPFELAKKEMQDVMGNYTFDRSFFPVPAKQQLTFCSDNGGINDFFDNLESLVRLGKKIFIGVLVATAILAMFPMGWREIKRYRKQQERTPLVMAAANDPMDVTYLVSRPYTSSFGLWMSKTRPDSISLASRRQNLIRWAIAYCTSDAALFVLTLALAGFFSCLCQIVLLRAIQAKAPALSNEVGAFADKVILQLNNASGSWQRGVNDAISRESHNINKNMLGWVNITTGAINNTLNTFVNSTSIVLDKAFGNTPLKDPIQDVLNCLILLKIKGVQTALTWVADHAHVDFPLLPNDTFSLGALASLNSDQPNDSFLADPGSKASDKITAALVRFVDALENGIKIEALVSTTVLCIWIFFTLAGFTYALVKMAGREKTRGMGGAPPSHSYAPSRTLHGHSMMSVPQQCSDFSSDNQERFIDIPLGRINTEPNFDSAETPALPEYKREASPGRALKRPVRTNGNPFDDDEYDETRLKPAEKI